MPTAFAFNILQQHAPKPEFGKPCNNCGLCCRVEACRVSKTFLRSAQAPCIALEFHDGKFFCGMVRRPSYYLNVSHLNLGGEADEILSEKFAALIYSGQGCGMPDEVAVMTREAYELATRTRGNAILEVQGSPSSPDTG